MKKDDDELLHHHQAAEEGTIGISSSTPSSSSSSLTSRLIRRIPFLGPRVSSDQGMGNSSLSSSLSSSSSSIEMVLKRWLSGWTMGRWLMLVSMVVNIVLVVFYVQMMAHRNELQVRLDNPTTRTIHVVKERQDMTVNGQFTRNFYFTQSASAASCTNFYAMPTVPKQVDAVPEPTPKAVKKAELEAVSEMNEKKKRVVKIFKEVFPSNAKKYMWNILNYIVTQDLISYTLNGDSDHRDPLIFGTPHIVTATSSAYFDRLENFVGSVHRLYESKAESLGVNTKVATPPNHSNDRLIKTVAETFDSELRSNYWLIWNSITSEEHRHVLIYDLGLTDEQRQKVSTWKYVDLVPFPFEFLPEHFRDLKSFAWKPMTMYLALQRYPSIIFLDSGVELWKRLDAVEEILLKKGYFHVKQEGLNTQWKCCGNIGELTHDSSYEYLGLNKEEYANKDMCSGGIQGYIRDSFSYKNVLIPTLECAWDQECIIPKGSGLNNHRQDQSIFSLLIQKAGIECEPDMKFYANHVTKDIVPRQDIVLYLRKGDIPKPFVDTIEYKKGFAVVVPFTDKQTKYVLENIDLWTQNKYAPCNTLFLDDTNSVDLIFYMNRNRNVQFENELFTKIYSYGKEKTQNPILKCFRDVKFMYAELSDARDLYPKGPTNQFYDLLHNPQIHGNYDHFFYMEPDCKPIRPNWIDAVKSITREYSIIKPNFWAIGTNYRGTVELGLPLHNRFHINGNAIYSTDISLRSFLKYIQSQDVYSYDTDPFEWMFKDFHHDFTKHAWHRYIYNEFVQNWWHSAWNEQTMRDRFPRTYFIHGGPVTEENKKP